MSYQRDYDRRLRIGLVGVGSHSYRNILPTLTYLPVELVAICDLDQDVARKTARQYGVDEIYADIDAMLEATDIDAVLLCVSPQLHPVLATKAMRAGKHVWMEKPASTSVAAVETMLDNRADRVCCVGYKKAFMPAARKAKELIALPESGNILSILGTYSMSIPRGAPGEPSKWMADGCHPMALMLELGGKVDAVTTHRGKAGGGSLVLHYASGAIGNFHMAQGVPAFQPHERYCVYTEKTSITIDNVSTVTYQRGIPFAYTTGTTFAPEGTDSGAVVWQAQNTMNTLENKAEFMQGLFGELRHFIDAVFKNVPATIGTLEMALDIARIYEAALLSDGNRVDLPG